jgi:large subunit ribosomal protein L13
MVKTEIAKQENIERKWYIVDAADKILGRLASRVATVLMGKHKAIWSPNVDTGDFVIVINAGNVKVTGKKLMDKVYYKHSGYLHGLKEETLFSMMERKPEMVIELAVRRMLPQTKLGRQMIKKLKVYRDSEHPHKAQNPEQLKMES